MQTNKLKTYAPKARRDFIAAVTRRAAKFGLSAAGASPAREEGQLVFIEGQPYPRSVGGQRAKLAARIAQQGFGQVMEAAAYTWFNRLMAIRYMELHGYLEHSYRVLSHPAGHALPEILEQAQHVALPGLDRERVIALKMDGTQDEALYRDLLLAQCRALHQAMPFLFEPVDHETELLLPDNLLQTDSLIRELVTAIPEADWAEIEIIGWLYQFYISEKKDQVIGKVVKSEDIPAATQLFTPNWIVKYMVQNSLGAQWLATYPDSPLKGQMAYYIEPAEQTPEVQAQLDAITPTSLNPEELTLMDPACGSGHILVEAYELFKAIYLERGYRLRDIPRLILEKNLFGLDIDERAAQLAGFALMMKARGDDRRLFERGVRLAVLALEEVESDEWRVVSELVGAGDLTDALGELGELFRHAKTFGSLIQVPESLAAKLPELRQLAERPTDDLLGAEARSRVGRLVRQAEVLGKNYNVVVANPPYMGGKYQTPILKKYLDAYYPGYEKDLYSAFIDRDLRFSKPDGRLGFMSPFTWMFISSHAHLRTRLILAETITSLVQLEYSGFEGATVPICTFTLWKDHVDGQKGCYIRLSDFRGSENQGPKTLEAIRDRGCGWFFEAMQDEFKKIPGAPVAYWASAADRAAFSSMPLLGELGVTRKGMVTARNEIYVREWPEVSQARTNVRASTRDDASSSRAKWFPYLKGGSFRKWYGNFEHVVDWEADGHRLRTTRHPSEDRVWATNFNLDFIFTESITWTTTSSSHFGVRFVPVGSLFDAKGSSAFVGDDERPGLLGYLASSLVRHFLKFLNPTIEFQPGDLANLPVDRSVVTSEQTRRRVESTVQLARTDWDTYERSWDFQSLPILTAASEPTPTLESSYTAWTRMNRDTIAEMKRLEEENNRLFIDAYGLQDELTPEVPIEQITLTVNPAYRYGKKVASDEWSVASGFGEELEIRFREDTMKELVSYAIGCAMGRYRLDRPGLIYAHSGNERFWEIWEGEKEDVASGEWRVASEGEGSGSSTDHSPLTTHHFFKPDDDGIIPITDTDWFDDDATHRVVEFISAAWKEGESGEMSVQREGEAARSSPLHSPLATHHSPLLERNLKFLADNLSPKKGESSRDTIRRYLSDSFFKDHLQTYKRRPIYWCFTSGKLKAFQCLVYLHRYHEGTLARMRMEYVVPLQGKMAARIEALADDIQAASTSAQAKRLQKERDKLVKQLEELRRFDEQLRHYADQRISLDLDDGVKVNYGKFGDLLAEVKAVTGKSAE